MVARGDRVRGVPGRDSRAEHLLGERGASDCEPQGGGTPHGERASESAGEPPRPPRPTRAVLQREGPKDQGIRRLSMQASRRRREGIPEPVRERAGRDASEDGGRRARDGGFHPPLRRRARGVRGGRLHEAHLLAPRALPGVEKRGEGLSRPTGGNHREPAAGRRSLQRIPRLARAAGKHLLPPPPEVPRMPAPGYLPAPFGRRGGETIREGKPPRRQARRALRVSSSARDTP